MFVFIMPVICWEYITARQEKFYSLGSFSKTYVCLSAKNFHKEKQDDHHKISVGYFTSGQK